MLAQVDAWHGAGKPPEDREGRAVCEAVERLVMERRAGRTVGPEGCEPLLWELLIVWEKRQYGHESFARRVPLIPTTQPDAPPKTVTITVDGQKQIVNAPPPGWVYNKAGRLICTDPNEAWRIHDQTGAGAVRG